MTKVGQSCAGVPAAAQHPSTLAHSSSADAPRADFKLHFQRMVEILGFNLPSGAAFGAAFLVGLRYG